MKNYDLNNFFCPMTPIFEPILLQNHARYYNKPNTILLRLNYYIIFTTISPDQLLISILKNTKLISRLSVLILTLHYAFVYRVEVLCLFRFYKKFLE